MTIEEAEAQIQNALKESGMKLGYQMVFPMYNILPDEVKLALSVLHKNGMKIVVTLQKPEESEK